jgi:hypothetical protein
MPGSWEHWKIQTALCGLFHLAKNVLKVEDLLLFMRYNTTTRLL